MRELASFDYRALGRLLRPMLEADGRGWRACAEEIGVTSSDLSRLMAGQAVAAHKVFAVCDWAGIADRQFYSGVFHGNSTETAIGGGAGR